MFALADCNNFFVSCERVFRPELYGRPVIVLSNNDGCAIARSNEAKAIGIKMGDPLFKIRHLVEKYEVKVFSSNMTLYADMSQRVRWVLEEFAPAVEVYSIDEAFLDLREMPIDDFDAYAKKIAKECWRFTSIPLSVGIAPTKTLAKIASKLCKQYPRLQGGCYLARPQDVEKVLRRYPIADVWGIGRCSVQKLQKIGVYTAHDFTQMPKSLVQSLLGLPGLRTWFELRLQPAIDFEDAISPKQSICVSRSFRIPITSCECLCEQIANFANEVAVKLRKQETWTNEICVFLRTDRFNERVPQSYVSSLVPLFSSTNDSRVIISKAVEETRNLFSSHYAYKKAGVIVPHALSANKVMHSLFDNIQERERGVKVCEAIDSLNSSFGAGTIRLAIQGDGRIFSSCNQQSPHYTTLWSDLPLVSVK